MTIFIKEETEYILQEGLLKYLGRNFLRGLTFKPFRNLFKAIGGNYQPILDDAKEDIDDRIDDKESKEQVVADMTRNLKEWENTTLKNSLNNPAVKPEQKVALKKFRNDMYKLLNYAKSKKV